VWIASSQGLLATTRLVKQRTPSLRAKRSNPSRGKERRKKEWIASLRSQ
jgi:hypothetical protein